MLPQLSFHFYLHGISFSISSLSICVSLDLKRVSYRQYICSFSLSIIIILAILSLLGAFTPVVFKVIIDTYIIAFYDHFLCNFGCFCSSLPFFFSILFPYYLITIFSVTFGFCSLFFKEIIF